MTLNACEGPLHDGAKRPWPASGWLEHRELVPRDGRPRLPACRFCFDFADFLEPGVWSWVPFEPEPLLGAM